MCQQAPRISHLFFIDDSLVFCRATLEECNELQRIFTLYEATLGQQLNKAKTALFFSKNTPRVLQEEIKTRFGAQVIRQHEKYLGLPSLVGRYLRCIHHIRGGVPPRTTIHSNLANETLNWDLQQLFVHPRSI